MQSCRARKDRLGLCNGAGGGSESRNGMAGSRSVRYSGESVEVVNDKDILGPGSGLDTGTEPAHSPPCGQLMKAGAVSSARGWSEAQHTMYCTIVYSDS